MSIGIVYEFEIVRLHEKKADGSIPVGKHSGELLLEICLVEKPGELVSVYLILEFPNPWGILLDECVRAAESFRDHPEKRKEEFRMEYGMIGQMLLHGNVVRRKCDERGIGGRDCGSVTGRSHEIFKLSERIARKELGYD